MTKQELLAAAERAAQYAPGYGGVWGYDPNRDVVYKFQSSILADLPRALTYG